MDLDFWGIPIEEDFKTAERKFLDQGISSDEVEKYFKEFKKAKDQGKIKEFRKKDIDIWARGEFEEFRKFVDDLIQSKTKTQVKRLQRIEGAELVVEDDEWLVYRIKTFEASRLYGSGTKWCITDPRGWKFHKNDNFYFLISKTRGSNDPWYKIALQVDSNGNETHWDAVDDRHEDLPFDIPGFEVEIPELKIDVDGEVMTIEEFQSSKNLVVKGGLDLENTPITSLPQGLGVGGNLNLWGTAITSLPDGLGVGGDLDLGYTKITSLPQGLKVGGSLSLADTKITSLPQGLKVGGGLELVDTKITSLPQGLEVGGYLDLGNTKITSLPKDLKVGGSLYLNGTPITSLPDGLEVGGSLYLGGSKITSLPQGLKMGGSLNLADTEITSLPQGLKVDGNLYLSGTKVKEIPKDAKIGGEVFWR